MERTQWVLPSCKVQQLLHLQCLRKLYVFNKPWHLTNQMHVNHLPWSHTRVTQFILCMVFFMYISTTQHLNYSRQSKKHNLQFIFLTHLWLWNKVKIIKPTMKMHTLSKVIIMQSLKDLALRVSEKKAMLKFFSSEEICQLSPLNMRKKSKWWYIHDLLDVINNRTKFHLSLIRT